MATLVIDCSVAVKWIVREQGSERAEDLLPSVSEGKVRAEHVLIAPAFILLEVHYVLAKKFNRKEVRLDQFLGATAQLKRHLILEPLDAELASASESISIASLNSPETAPDAPRFAPFSIYDSVYIALARREDALLATADIKQAAAAKSNGLEVLSI
jgi:predicted nucleic acid-binding protein